MKLGTIRSLIIFAVIIFLGIASGAFAERHSFSQGEMEHARAVHAKHAEDLIGLPGVHGVGIGESSGKLGIVILVDDEARLKYIPKFVEDMPAVVHVVGEISAHSINLGVSGGNSLICNGYCAGGTVGFKVCDNTAAGVDGIITNNHVAASGCPSLCPNNAPIGTAFFSPGVIDNKPVCSTTGAINIGALRRYIPLVLNGQTTNYVDAAFVQSSDVLISHTIQGLGVQNDSAATPFLGQAVCKSGRSSGVTCGTVTGINMTVNVNYGQPCGTGRFSNVIMYSPVAPYTVMSQPGDSGSPVVDANTNAAVALNFAGTQSGYGIGNPIGPVLSALQVSLCASGSGSSSPRTTVTTSPPGEQINVDGTSYSSPQTFAWSPGSSHTISVPSPQSTGMGSRYVFSSWSDGGAQTHTITTSSTGATYTASLIAQYQLTTSVSPAGGGSIVPNCLAGCWYNSGTSTSVTATANAGYIFSSWSGAISGSGNPIVLTMNAPMTVTANFYSVTSSFPNLVPYQPAGWSDKIVVSNKAGSTTDSSPLRKTDRLYVDWAVLNNGTGPTNKPFYTTLYVDGVQKYSWYYGSPLPPNYYIYSIGYSIGQLTAGTHTIKIVTDATNVIVESNESDNAYTKTIIVQ
ncbi:MAG TPA: CARDB domain-containing protein [Thermodesulfovibrionales bacterium]|nr:CARDB domain-containing protein [Thermodesulfovibrionales bacterium]